jgi:hypothetical protein
MKKERLLEEFQARNYKNRGTNHGTTGHLRRFDNYENNRKTKETYQDIYKLLSWPYIVCMGIVFYL